MSAVIGCGIAAAVFAYLACHSSDEGGRDIACFLAFASSGAAIVAGFMA